MTHSKEGVRDPIRVDPDCENAVVEGWPYPSASADTIYEVDDDGYLRDDAGDLLPWVGPSVIATDVDPETWGDHYHNPADCPEKDLPVSSLFISNSTCEDCSKATEREHDRSYYTPDETPEPNLDAEEAKERMEEAIDILSDGDGPETMFVSKQMQAHLQEDAGL